MRICIKDTAPYFLHNILLQLVIRNEIWMLTETKSLSLQRDLVVDNVIDQRPYKSKQVLHSLIVVINHKIKLKNEP